jgi:hypothetical protein
VERVLHGVRVVVRAPYAQPGAVFSTRVVGPSSLQVNTAHPCSDGSSSSGFIGSCKVPCRTARSISKHHAGGLRLLSHKPWGNSG